MIMMVVKFRVSSLSMMIIIMMITGTRIMTALVNKTRRFYRKRMDNN